MSTVFNQIRRALQKTESIEEHGLPFEYPGVTPGALGVLGQPRAEVTALAAGPQTRLDATFTVRKAWFAKSPASQGMLIVGGRKYQVTKLDSDEVSYEFSLLDRGLAI